MSAQLQLGRGGVWGGGGGGGGGGDTFASTILPLCMTPMNIIIATTLRTIIYYNYALDENENEYHW